MAHSFDKKASWMLKEGVAGRHILKDILLCITSKMNTVDFTGTRIFLYQTSVEVWGYNFGSNFQWLAVHFLHDSTRKPWWNYLSVTRASLLFTLSLQIREGSVEVTEVIALLALYCVTECACIWNLSGKNKTAFWRKVLHTVEWVDTLLMLTFQVLRV